MIFYYYLSLDWRMPWGLVVRKSAFICLNQQLRTCYSRDEDYWRINFVSI